MTGKLTIQEVAKILVEKNGLNLREANQFATEFFAIILSRLQDGDMVKVKGLGTFKIINVEARESVSVRTGERVVIDSHSKVSFTPDTVMKELVNKPFSQFETVVLNDGVEFVDLPEEVDEEEPVMGKETESVSEIEPEPVSEPEPEIESENEDALVRFVDESAQPEVEEQKAIDVAPVPAKEEEPVAENSFVEEDIEEDDEEDEDDAEEESSHWGRWLIGCLGVVALLVAAAYGGYEYGCQQQQMLMIADTLIVRDTVYVTKTQDSLEVAKPEEAVAAKTTAEPAVKKEAKTEQPDQWAAKDERVRLGAYRIVGLSHEVTVLEGQTFYSICRAHLGPDMQCYVEVYNNLPKNPQIKAGQVLKIPKLELKKRRK